MQKEILTAADVADVLTVSKKTIEAELRKGNLKGVKRFGKWFVLRSSLIDYVKPQK